MMESYCRSLLEVVEKLEEREDSLDYLRHKRLVGPFSQENSVGRNWYRILHSTKINKP